MLTWQPWEGWIRQETGRPFEEVIVKVQKRELRPGPEQEGPSEGQIKDTRRMYNGIYPWLVVGNQQRIKPGLSMKKGGQGKGRQEDELGLCTTEADVTMGTLASYLNFGWLISGPAHFWQKYKLLSSLNHCYFGFFCPLQSDMSLTNTNLGALFSLQPQSPLKW